MAKQRFKITKFRNPSGQEVYRVSGTLHGKRIRENFKSREEALEARQKLDIRFLNEREEGKTIWTTLSHDENADAVTALRLLRNAGSQRSLTFGIQFFLKHFQESAEQMSLEKAVREYLDEKSREEGRGIISKRQFLAIRFELDRLQRKLGNPMVGEILSEELRAYLEKDATALKTWNNRRGYLSTFFKFCMAKKYAGHNPVLDVPQYKIKHRRGTAETLSSDEAVKLMEFIETYQGKAYKDGRHSGRPGCMVPYFALALFAGIRPDWMNGEIGKLRPEHVNLETGVIHIEPEVSKVNEKRTILIQPNLRLWLEKYPLTEYPAAQRSRTFREMRLDIRDRFKLGHDVLRHTYISMLVGAFRSVGDAALQAGNSETVIRKHYLDLKSVAEADQFWRICPKGMSLPEKLLKVDGRFVVPTPVEEEAAAG